MSLRIEKEDGTVVEVPRLVESAGATERYLDAVAAGPDAVDALLAELSPPVVVVTITTDVLADPPTPPPPAPRRARTTTTSGGDS